MGITRPLALLALVAIVPSCGDDGGGAPGTELGPCVQGQFCQSPLQCVQGLCVHPDQTDDTAADASTGQGESDPTQGGSASTTTGMGSASTTASTGETSMTAGDGDADGGMTVGDATAGDATAGDCVPPECSAYASKMATCYPMADIDWYGSCLETADICHIDGPCITPAAITCSISMPCDVVVDGGCIDDAC